jgi:hypothetical protein
VYRPIKAVAVIVLALWGLAAMHCKLEALPGLDFLRSCCFAESAPSVPEDCESDGCGAVEDGDYRAEERTDFAPQPLFILGLPSSGIEAPMSDLDVCCFVASESPPELPKAWQFSHRTALAPRAPSLAS